MSSAHFRLEAGWRSALVAIASYGTAQDAYLARLLAEYRKLERPVRIVVLSDRPKPLVGAEVICGLSSRNPHSLPFAHRKFFAENADRYDLFIYSEDDVLITKNHICAFLAAQSRLRSDEIAGFVRSEADPQGRRYITSLHSHFRWLPGSTVERNGVLFGKLSNDHSGCFIATQSQLRKAIRSGGFVVPPHSEGYGMLESAASDIYTRCGLTRLIPLTRIGDFVVSHLPNKYYKHTGIPYEEFESQALALAALHTGGGWKGELFEARSRAPGFRWSKDLYEKPDLELLQKIPKGSLTVLSVGCGWGENEAWLCRNGLKVCAVPVNAVLADALRRRGIRTEAGPFADVTARLAGEEFDVVLMSGGFHLLPEPLDWLRRLARLLRPGGRLVAAVHHTADPAARLKDWLDRNGRPTDGDGGHLTNSRVLRRWCDASNLMVESITPLLDPGSPKFRRLGRKVLPSLVASRFILVAGLRGSAR